MQLLLVRSREPAVSRTSKPARPDALREGSLDACPLLVLLAKGRGGLALPRRLQGVILRFRPEFEGA